MIFCVILLLFYCLELFLFLPTFRFFVLKDAILFFIGPQICSKKMKIDSINFSLFYPILGKSVVLILCTSLMYFWFLPSYYIWLTIRNSRSIINIFIQLTFQSYLWITFYENVVLILKVGISQYLNFYRVIFSSTSRNPSMINIDTE